MTPRYGRRRRNSGRSAELGSAADREDAEAVAALRGDDPELAAALKQFADSWLVWRAAYEAATREGKVTRPLLAGAARAEFTRFTSLVAPATVVDRPRSGYLRANFAQMLRTPATTQPDKPE